MKPVIKYYEPGKVITLFDSKIDATIQGVLLFSQPQIAKKTLFETVYSFIETFPWQKILYFLKTIDYQKGYLNLVSTTKSFKWKTIYIEAIKFGDKVRSVFNDYITFLDGWFSGSQKFLPKRLSTLSIPSTRQLFKLLAGVSLTISFLSLLLVIMSIIGTNISWPFSDKSQTVSQSTNTGPRIGFEKLERSFQPQPEPTPTSFEFMLSVPKIGLESDVTSNVDLADEAVYRQKLKETGVAHALGSYFPGQNGPIYLFAHSTDTVANISLFNAKFFALKDLERGDELLISYHGKKYKYVITDKKVIEPTDIDTIQQSDAKLILQTCWPPGTDWQRLIVFADQQLI